MAVDPLDLVTLGRTSLRVTRLGFGAATIGGLWTEVSDADAIATARHALSMGIRYVDVAPVYGYGNSERRLGAALASVPREAVTISTKVGRLLVPRELVTDAMDVDRQRGDGGEDYYYRGTPPVRPVFDYSADGVRRSVEASLIRLGVDRIDLLFIHDPDNHWTEAISEAYPALERLRSEGVVGGIGVGMNQAAMLERFAREGDFDVFLMANQYTLLDQSGLDGLLPVCEARGIAVVVGGVFNSGILADPRPGSRFGYAPAADALVAHAQRLRDACDRHGVPLKAAAIQFVIAHPAVACVLAGARNIGHLDEFAALMRHRIPAQLWDELRAEGLLPAHAPTPGGAPTTSTAPVELARAAAASEDPG